MFFLEILKNVAIPLTATYILILAYRRNTMKAIVEFYSQGDSKEQKQYRKVLYDAVNNANGDLSDVDYKGLDNNGDLAKIVSFYDEWATLEEKLYLPFGVFKNITGITAVRVFYMIKPYIDIRRKETTEISDLSFCNNTYAGSYEKLVNKIEQKYIKKMRNKENSN